MANAAALTSHSGEVTFDMTDLPQDQIEFKGRRSSRAKFLIAGSLILAAVLLMIFTTTRSTAMYYVTVDELLQRQAELQGRGVRVSGTVVGESVEFDAAALLLRFDLKGANSTLLPVIFQGPKPDQLRDGAEAIVEGMFSENSLDAKTVLLKCPSKYEEMGVSEEKVEAVR